MQTKRLTLEEYRQLNAVWLSNNRGNELIKMDKYIVIRYIDYLYAYGVNKEILKSLFDRSVESELTSQEIEEILKEENTEHCHH